MITLFKDLAMTKPLWPISRNKGTGVKKTFIAQHGVWNIVVDDFKEVDYTLSEGTVSLSRTPALNERVIIIPENVVNLNMLNTQGSKTFTNTVYAYTPAPQATNLVVKLETDHEEITSALLKVHGATFTVCADLHAATVGPHPIAMQLTVPSTTDIRLFPDIQLCAIRLENVTDSTYMAVNDAGEIDLCLFASGATQRRRVIINVL